MIFRKCAAGCLLLALVWSPMAEQHAAGDPSAETGVMRVGLLAYGEAEGWREAELCFSDDFLDTLARRTNVRLHRELEPVDLASERLFDYPFVVMAGEGAFTLSEIERDQLRDYVQLGGFVLASAGCSSEAWAQSFTALMADLFGEEALKPIGMDHPVFHTAFEIEYLDVRGEHDGAPAMFALEVDGAARVIFSPLGLNDTSNAGGDCCCCGSSELRNARRINANILAYALTH